ncbi:BrnA antitoxin family protein [Maricaulis sp.]|uniref:BrnA antitoxin family protein n=2 Tax=Maricaulis sp. TaxID=1486257 RepID=UPI003A8DC185
MAIIRKKLSDLHVSEERVAEIADMPDEDIDYSDIPELDEAWFAKAELRMPVTKEQVTLRLDVDILRFFKAQGKGYQTRINSVLRAYVDAMKKGEA